MLKICKFLVTNNINDALISHVKCVIVLALISKQNILLGYIIALSLLRLILVLFIISIFI